MDFWISYFLRMLYVACAVLVGAQICALAIDVKNDSAPNPENRRHFDEDTYDFYKNHPRISSTVRMLASITYVCCAALIIKEFYNLTQGAPFTVWMFLRVAALTMYIVLSAIHITNVWSARKWFKNHLNLRWIYLLVIVVGVFTEVVSIAFKGLIV